MVAVVAVAAAAVVASGGAALAAIGVSASAVGMGAAISGTLAVGVMAVSDIMRGEVSDLAGLCFSWCKRKQSREQYLAQFWEQTLKERSSLLKCSSVVEFPF